MERIENVGFDSLSVIVAKRPTTIPHSSLLIPNFLFGDLIQLLKLRRIVGAEDGVG